MNSLLILGVVAVAILFWILRTRSARRRWVEELDLIGQWDLEGENTNNNRIEFIGARGDAGNYMASTDDTLESGNWHLTSYFLVLEPNDGEPVRHELRRFEPGRIGINGPGREKQIYRKKRVSNIIKLHEHHSKNP